jgi:protein tyrosine/serine phosphatase
MHRLLGYLPAAIVAASIFGVPYAYAIVRDKHLRNFRVVEDRVLYRSGQLSPAGLERVIHDYGIRSVVCFRDVEEGKATAPPDQWEEELCARLGVNYYRLPLRVWAADEKGAVPAEQNVKRFLEILADPKNRPVLAHCYRGVHRTGAYCAIYRMQCNGWTNEDAIGELKALGYTTFETDEDVRDYLRGYTPSGKNAGKE